MGQADVRLHHAGYRYSNRCNQLLHRHRSIPQIPSDPDKLRPLSHGGFRTFDGAFMHAMVSLLLYFIWYHYNQEILKN